MDAKRYEEVLASAAEDEPSRADIARLEARLGPVLGGPSGPGPSGAPSPAGWPALKLIVGLAVVPVAAAIFYLASREDPRPIRSTRVVAPVQTPQPLAALPPPPETPRAAAPIQAAEPVVESSASTGRRPVVPADSPATLAEEVRLLREAQDIVASSPGRTLELGEEHRRRFPRGTLTQEREVLVIDALVRLGRGDAAVRRAEGFSRRFPGSGHLARVQDLVAEVSTKP